MLYVKNKLLGYRRYDVMGRRKQTSMIKNAALYLHAAQFPDPNTTSATS